MKTINKIKTIAFTLILIIISALCIISAVEANDDTTDYSNKHYDTVNGYKFYNILVSLINGKNVRS